ncbi:Mating-type M-specific polypeptide Mc [Wallemia ichthyophaga EXF-994]|uniref:Mating-type M-specific polypeptide Mc n=1 Tax=Wallemia ichthyophaga (strain EXF-994 / CBS 113033) TaxID=1299270 RepID=R9A9C9_WALI9|nr:Mating-type M-specific polypeptide Mc [Wallemia ichthyophaga EXF-994]TIA95352.1 hypothetical protein E3P95_03742 [Wallemia ichthyophaga]EOQ98813.1 Mating-type M-specific polypeptide Mc [Wallemia ichthyophaga EXF-994]TIA96329.1 hypothetical protein E3P94_03738 [Wallemia ichthyophaga]TIB29198.1 hypothetical protein E3P84_03789 [Wallemia ichthyophaga]TIB38829.1 hypothetical protein E3P83_03795 [Wallemia ichthyophaga]
MKQTLLEKLLQDGKHDYKGEYNMLDDLFYMEVKEGEMERDNEYDHEYNHEYEDENVNENKNKNKNENEGKQCNADHHQRLLDKFQHIQNQIAPQCSQKKRIRRTLKDPKHPKPAIPRPRNAWIIYRSHKSKELREAAVSQPTNRPDSRAISATVSDLWQKEAEEVKEKFTELAKDEKRMHRTLWPDYKYQPRKAGRPRQLRHPLKRHKLAKPQKDAINSAAPPPPPRKKRSESRCRGRPRNEAMHSRAQSDVLTVKKPLYNPNVVYNPPVTPIPPTMLTHLLTTTPIANDTLPILDSLPSSPLPYQPGFWESPLGSPPSIYPSSQSEYLNSPRDLNIAISALEYSPTDVNVNDASDLFADIEALFNKQQTNHDQASCFFNVSQII